MTLMTQVRVSATHRLFKPQRTLTKHFEAQKAATKRATSQ